MLKTKKINNVLMIILVCFTIFMSAFNYTHLPFWLSYIKDIIIAYFFVYLILKKKFKFPKIDRSFYFLFVIVLIISWLGLYNATNTSSGTIIIHSIRYIDFFLLFFIFANFDELCDMEYKKVINLYLTLSIVLIFVHLFGYFVPNNIVSINISNKFDTSLYRNRISIGQPAIAIFPMIISYFYLLLFSKLDKKYYIKSILLLIGVLIAIPVTGIVSVIICLIGLFMWALIKKQNDLLRKILSTVAIFLAIVFVGIAVIKLNPKLNTIYHQQKVLLTVKMSSLFKENIEDPSIAIRDAKYKIVLSNNSSFLQKIFGVGKYGYNHGDVSIGNMENSYRIFRVEYGFLGLTVLTLFFVAMVISNIYNSIKYTKTAKQCILIAVLFLIVALHAYTLDILYLPTISYTIPLFYCFLIRNDLNENIDSK